MPFVFLNNVIPEFQSLRKNYEAAAHIDLDKARQPYTISCFFGAKDVDSRKKQIVFIEQWLTVLNKDLSTTGIFDSSEARERHIRASRLLMVVGFYIISQIDSTYKVRSGSSATLAQLIHKAMGISSLNSMDEETRACCLLTSNRYLEESRSFDAANALLSTAFKEREWYDFLVFTQAQCSLLDAKYRVHYPIASLLMPICAKPLELAGYATGYVLGDTLGRSNEFLPARCALTIVLGSCVVGITGPSVSVGIMLFASGRILDTFCGISLAWLMGSALKTVGQGIGFGIGIPLDLACKLLNSATIALGNIYSCSAKLTGISLIDGRPVIDGVAIKLEALESEFVIVPGEGASSYAAPLDDEIKITVTIKGEKVELLWPSDRPVDISTLEEWIVAQSRRVTTPDPVSLSTSEREGGLLLECPN